MPIMTIKSDSQHGQVSHGGVIVMVRALLALVDNLAKENQKLQEELK
jgi:hypothetical protein